MKMLSKAVVHTDFLSQFMTKNEQPHFFAAAQPVNEAADQSGNCTDGFFHHIDLLVLGIKIPPVE